MKKLAVLAAMFLILPGAAGAQTQGCQGDNLKESVAIIQDTYRGATQIGLGYSDMNTMLGQMLALIQKMNARIVRLPPSCQVLVNEWARVIAQQLNSGSIGSGTQCMSGVCCNSTECLSN